MQKKNSQGGDFTHVANCRQWERRLASIFNHLQGHLAWGTAPEIICQRCGSEFKGTDG